MRSVEHMSLPPFLLPSRTVSTLDHSKYSAINDDQLTPQMAELSHLTERFSEIVDSRLQQVETDFLLAFQTHMVTVNSDLETLRRRADTTEADGRREQRVLQLRREVDWFKAECLRLNDAVRNKQNQNSKFRAKLNGIQEELKFLKKLLDKTSLQRTPPVPDTPLSQIHATLQLNKPEIVDMDLVKKAEIFVDKEHMMHKYFDKEIERVKKELAKHSSQPEQNWMLEMFETQVNKKLGNNKLRLTKTDKIDIFKYLLTNEQVLNALLISSSRVTTSPR